MNDGNPVSLNTNPIHLPPKTVDLPASQNPFTPYSFHCCDIAKPGLHAQ